MKEEFEVNLEEGIEKINLPAKQSSRFVHDFYSVSDRILSIFINFELLYIYINM